MRISLFHPYMFGKGGGERHVSMVAHHLAEAHEVTVYGIWGDEPGAPHWWEGLQLERAWPHINYPLLRRSLNGLSCLYREAPGQDADLFIGFGPHGVMLAGRGEVPSIGYYFHPWDPLYKTDGPERVSLGVRLVFRTWPISHILRGIDLGHVQNVGHLAANSPHVARRITDIYGIECHVMCPGVEAQELVKPARNIRPYVVMPTRFTPHKNIEAGIRALQLLRETHDVDLIITGSLDNKAYFSRIWELSRELGVWPNVRYLGFVPEQLLKELYRGALCHWFTAIDEDFGLTPLEAMVQECPVVASDDGGGRYTVEPDRTGWLVDPHSPEGFADYARVLLQDPVWRGQMGRRGRRIVLQEHTWAHHFKEWDELLERAAT